MKTIGRVISLVCVGLMLLGMSARGATGFGDSNTISVDTRPATITGQPVSQSVRTGAAVTLGVTAACPTPLSYQWRKNSNDIAGATSASLNFASVTVSDTGGYDVLVSWPWGSLLSSAATLVVNTPPSITSDPRSLSVIIGTNVTFSVTAAGTAPLIYQWRKNGGSVGGATNVTLVLNNVAAGDAATYDVVVSNPWGTAVSASASLVINLPPWISQPPASQSVLANTTVTFSVTAAGTAPLSYQWRKNGVVITGAVNSSLVLPGVGPANAAGYDVVVSSPYGSATSAVAYLVVNVPPYLTVQPQATSVLLGGATSFAVGAGGTQPLVCQWRKGGVVLTGKTGFTLALSSVTTNDGGAYSAVITNAYGTVTSASAVLTIDMAPFITVQPVGLTVAAGRPAAFSVVAGGTGPLAYQWRKDGVGISGATNAVYSIAVPTMGDAGRYDVVVVNPHGSVTSAGADLMVTPATFITVQNSVGAPGGVVTVPVMMVALGEENGVGFSVSYDPAVMYYQSVQLGSAAAGGYLLLNTGSTNVGRLGVGLALPSGSRVAPGTQEVFRVTFRTVAGYTNTAGTSLVFGDLPVSRELVDELGGSLDVSWFDGAVHFSPVITMQPVSQVVTQRGGWLSFSVGATGTWPLSRQWYKDGVAISGQTNAVLTIGNAGLGDAGSYMAIVTNQYGMATSVAAVGGVHFAPLISGDPVGLMVMEGAGASFTVAADGSPVLSYQWRKDGVVIGGATGSSLGLSVVTTNDAGGYDVVVGNAYGTSTSGVATLTVTVAPYITMQPQGVSVLAGGTATLTVGAGGTQPLVCQWWKDGVVLAGQTGFSLTLNNVWTNDAGIYSAVVMNGYGTVRSAGVGLTVNVPAYLVVQPGSLSVMQGGSAAFGVVAGGTDPLNYQWRKDGVGIVGATNLNLRMSGVTTNDAGGYDVVVANAYGSVTSVVASLTVTVAPYITLQPRGTSVLAGGEASFTVGAGGTQPLVCQWRKDGVLLAGKTGLTLTLSGVGEGDAGSYRVVITNAYGVVTSEAAVLTVNVPPYLTTQPMDLAVLEGSYGGFTVVAGGSDPLSYQWRKNGISLPGGTDDILSLSGVRTNDVGSYDVVVSNGYGAITSLVATLTVYVKPFIATQPESVSVVAGGTATFTVGAGGTQPLECQWWKDGVALVGKTGLTLVLSNVRTNDAGSYSARVSNAFGNAASAAATLTVNVSPFITGQPVGTSVTLGGSAGFSVVAGGTTPLGYQWRRGGGSIAGATTSSLALSGVTTNDAGGYDVVVANAYGSVTSVVATLTVNVPPYIGVQPQGVTVLAGGTASLTVGAGGTQPLVCQWRKDGAALSGKTGFTLSLSGVGTNDNGGYDAVIANAYGSATSAVATLVVPWAKLAMTGSTQMAGISFSVPVSIEAVGNENAVGLSLNYDPVRLQFVSASIASNLAGASLLLNTGSTNAGRIGLGISLPSGVALTNGLQELVRVVFLPPVSSSSVVTTLGFGDAPVARQVVDAAAVAQPASFAGAVVTLTPAEYEGDVIPRGRVDGVVRIADWVQVGRFVAALDLATNTGEFQRADCAPRSTQGDGRLTVTDWVQAGRYAVSLDPSVLVGGPRTPTVGPAKRDLQPMGGGRVLRVVSQNVVPGEPVTVQVQLDAQGDENALGFSVGYDASRLTLKKVTLGSGAAGATVNLNTNTNTVGRVGMAILFQGEGAFGFGQQEVALLEFGTSSGLAGSSALVFGDLPVWRDAANSQAESLATTYENGAITATGGAPALEISNSGSGIRLSWPLGQSSYALEKASGVASGSWSGVAGDRSTNASTISVNVPLENAPSFFRLRKN